MGRPSALDRVIGRNNDDEPITAEERILDDLRNGAYIETACANVGIHKDTYYGWRKIAAKIRAAHDGRVPTRGLTAHEKRCVAFSDSVDESEASFERDALERLGLAARGGAVKTKTVIKRGPPNPAIAGDAGAVLETTTTTERLPPDASVDEWRLERKFPQKYGRRVEVVGDDGGPVLFSLEERTEMVADQLEAFLRARAESPDQEREPTS